MNKALRQIIKRCENAKIQYEWAKDLSEEETLHILIPKGSTTHSIEIYNYQRAKNLLASDFEIFEFVQGFQSAICSYSLSSIESAIDTIGYEIPGELILSRLLDKDYQHILKDLKAGKEVSFKLKGGKNNSIKVSIGTPSHTFLGMLSYYDKNNTLSVRIEGLSIKDNKESAEQLERITNSLFYEIERKRFDLRLFINREHNVKTNDWGIKKWQRKKEKELGFCFPKFQYDKEPIELYWYAEGSNQMPLLQYLAYYQILEWYYPKYSMLGAKTEISNLLKDPEFDTDDDNDIVKIINRVSSKLGRNVDENSQLRDTMRECISENELILEINIEPIKEYFKKEYKTVSACRVSEDDSVNDLRNQLANRYPRASSWFFNDSSFA